MRCCRVEKIECRSHRDRNACFCLLASIFCGWAAAQAPPANYDESRVGAYTLPDPLIFNNGKPVRERA